MSPIKYLNNLLVIENLLGIYRNYSNQKKIKRRLIILQIVTQMIAHAVITIISEYYLLKRPYLSFQITFIFACYSVVAYVNSVTSIMSGIYHSRPFMSYYRSIFRVSQWFKDDKTYNYSIKKVMWFSVAIIVITMATHVSRTTQILMRLAPSDSFIVYFPLLISLTLTKVTIGYQYLVFFIVVKLVANLFKCLILLISDAQKRVACGGIRSDGQQSDITREQIHAWVALYRDLVSCCKNVTVCFGPQYFFSILLSIFQYILLMYQIFYLIIFNVGTTSQQLQNKVIVIVLFSYCSVLMMPLIAGQMVMNQAVKFNRALVRLYNTMIIDPRKAEVKLIKDFIRLIKKNPIEIKLSTNIPAGMYLLPVIVSLLLNYLIVMLQFNHII